MALSNRSAASDASIRSMDAIRFFGRYYHFLKGGCYAPAGVLLCLAMAALAVLRPAWLAAMGGWGATAGAALLTAPWAWHMHQRYEDRYGRVRPPEEEAGGSLFGASGLSAPLFMGILLAAMCWIALCFIYIPENTPIADNHALPLFAGYYLVLRSVQAPDGTTRLVYASSALLLVGTTLLPLVVPDPWIVALANYGGLGAVAATVGFYNHHLLSQTFGSFSTDTTASDE